MGTHEKNWSPANNDDSTVHLDASFKLLQVLRMESLVLKVLSFDVAVPTANWFCDNLLKECNADDKTRALAMVCLFL